MAKQENEGTERGRLRGAECVEEAPASDGLAAQQVLSEVRDVREDPETAEGRAQRASLHRPIPDVVIVPERKEE